MGAPIYDYKLTSIHSGATSAYHVSMLQGRRKKAVWQWSPLDSIQKTAFYREMSKLQSLIETIFYQHWAFDVIFFAEAVPRICSSHRLHFYPLKPHEALFVEWSLKDTFLPRLKLLASAEISLRLWVKEDLDLMRVKTMKISRSSWGEKNEKTILNRLVEGDVTSDLLQVMAELDPQTISSKESFLPLCSRKWDETRKNYKQTLMNIPFIRSFGKVNATSLSRVTEFYGHSRYDIADRARAPW